MAKGNSRVTNTSLNRKEGLSGMAADNREPGGYKSKSSGGSGGFSGIRDTSGGQKIPANTRDNPVAGSVQSGNNNRGGPATQNCDRAFDSDCQYMAPGLEALRKKQDRARGGAND